MKKNTINYKKYISNKLYQSNLKEIVNQSYNNELAGVKHPAALLLDSSLISQTKFKYYTHKIIKCGNYIQVYDYNQINIKTDKTYEKIKKPIKVNIIPDNKVTKTKKQIKIDLEYKKFYSSPLYNFCRSREEIEKSIKHKEIRIINKSKINKVDIKNINRSKFELQRLVKANENVFKTFITLTFEDNITSIENANKMFNSFRTYIKRLKSDFKYVCVPEFQKRGAVHYHLLTNIDYTDILLLSQNEIKLWSKKSRKWEIGKNIVGWNKGYSLAKDINSSNTNVVGYITKYMTKDIDNRLWGKRKYLYSYNLIRPKITYLNLEELDDFSKYVNLTSDSNIKYSTEYYNIFDNKIIFNELKKE